MSASTLTNIEAVLFRVDFLFNQGDASEKDGKGEIRRCPPYDALSPVLVKARTSSYPTPITNVDLRDVS